MDYIISADATCDLTKEQQKELNVKVLDMLYLIDGQAYGGSNETLPLSEFYKKMRLGSKTSTSMINEIDAEEYFSNLLKEGKDVLHITLSSGLSGTYDCVERVARNLNANNKNKIYVVDSKNGSTGEGMIVEYAVKLKEEGKSIQENLQLLTETVDNFNAYFAVQDLKHLVVGGRISKSAAFIGNVLQIKPIICANEEGKLAQCGKAIGEKKSLFMLIDKVKQRFDDIYNKIYVSHANCVENAMFIINKIKTIFPTANVALGEIGPIMGAHCGPGTVAVFFMGKNRCFNN